MFILLLSLLTIAYADEQVVTVDKNERAPFAGTLLNPPAAARILATTNTDVQTCLIESKHNLAIQDADFKLQLANKQAALVACQLRYDRSEQIYKDHIKYLEQRAVEPSWKAPTLFAGGVVTGIVVILTSAYALDKIGD